MTDSTTNIGPGDGAFEGGSGVAGLEAGAGSATGDVEDRTAADVFDRLRDDVGDEGGADDVLGDETPDDIIASTAEADPERDGATDDGLLADEDELAELLTGRTEAEGFLWVDPEPSDDDRATEDDDVDAMPDWEFDDVAPDGAESGTALEREEGSPKDAAEPSDPADGAAVGTEPAGDADGRSEPERDESAVDTPEETPADADTDDGTEREAADESSGLFGRLRSAVDGLF